MDFKTDLVATPDDLSAAAARHGPQINLYRRVASVLTGVPPEQIVCVLIFTRFRKFITVQATVPRK
jgi:hypothetical protein